MGDDPRKRGGEARLLALAALYLCGHALLITLLRTHAQVVSIACVTVAAAWAAVACARRARRAGETKDWWIVALAMLLWSAGMAANLPFAATGQGAVNPGVSMLLFVLYMAPLLFVLAWRPEDPAAVRRIDGGLALVLAGLFCAIVAGHASVAGTPLENVPALRSVYDVGNAFILGLAFIRWLAGAGSPQRVLFGSLAIYASIYFAVAFYVNHVESIGPGYGVFSDLAIDFPFLVLALIASRRGRPHAEIALRRVDKVVQLASPLVLPLALLLASAHLMPSQPWLAGLGIAAAVLGYGMRTVLAQLRAQEQLERLAAVATIDALTGIANRRRFDERLASEWMSARPPAITLLLVDVDHFKAINDRVGHPGGDACLRAVAHVLGTQASRSGAFAARYGGEEFVVLVPAREEGVALALAESMREAVSGSDACRTAAGGRVTVSIGVAVARAGGTPQDLVDAADAALYRAKGAGRDRVVLHARDASSVTTAS
ncbi:diguanylate cyclase [Dokdonella sp. MW10]|uniref:GGDEF domain-containing protein n=1 Tax=Dokdonella sp. MW10 TaxID=2992926 RepID=UPI003F7FBD69